MNGKLAAAPGDGAHWFNEFDAKDRLIRKALFDAQGKPVLIDGIGAQARYTYDDNDELAKVTYLDAGGRVIPVAVEVQSVAPGSAAERVGIEAGDRFISLHGDKLTSVKQFQYLTARESTADPVLIIRRGGALHTIKVSPGPLGVTINNVRVE